MYDEARNKLSLDTPRSALCGVPGNRDFIRVSQMHPLGNFATPLLFAQSYDEDARASFVLNSFAIHKKNMCWESTTHFAFYAFNAPPSFLSYVRCFDCCLKWLDEAIPSTYTPYVR